MITAEILTTSLDQQRLPFVAVAMPEPKTDTIVDNSSDVNYELIWHFGHGNDYY